MNRSPWKTGYLIPVILLLGALAAWTLGGCNSKELNVWQEGAVSGVVLDSNGTPIPDVEVSVTYVEAKATTDDQGYFMLTGLTTGDNTLSAQRRGYTSDARQILVEGNKTLEKMNLLLIKLPVWQAETNITTSQYMQDYSVTLSSEAAQRFQ